VTPELWEGTGSKSGLLSEHPNKTTAKVKSIKIFRGPNIGQYKKLTAKNVLAVNSPITMKKI
jgi:hypothetical protein